MSVFSEEWRKCLREHYKTVIREGDHVTLDSLRLVMAEVGFGEDELRQLQVEATMRADEVADDFTPDLDILKPQAAASAEPEFQPHPLECQCPACMEQSLTPHDDEGQPIAPEDLDPERIAAEQDEDDDGPRQLSMF